MSTWGEPKFQGVCSRLEKIADLLKQFSEIHATETMRKLDNLKRIAEKAKEVRDKQKLCHGKNKT